MSPENATPSFLFQLGVVRMHVREQVPVAYMDIYEGNRECYNIDFMQL